MAYEHQKVKAPSREELRDLITEIGGPDRLRELLSVFYQTMEKDLLIGFFFTGKDLNEISHQQSNFMLMAAGLIDRFDGKGPSTAHVKLPPILQGHFDRRLVILREVLTAASISPPLIERWIRFEESFRLVVVANP